MHRHSMVLLLLAACAPGDRGDAPPAEAPAVPETRPAAVTVEDFRSLRWIEGTWRGTGGGIPPFFERYAFVDDSTLRRESFADSTLATVSDTALIAVRAGQVLEPLGAPRWQVTAFDSASWRFESLERAGSAFTWRTTGPDTWTAVLESRDATGAPQERTYILERIR